VEDRAWLSEENTLPNVDIKELSRQARQYESKINPREGNDKQSLVHILSSDVAYQD
jgi:hypothetical protein